MATLVASGTQVGAVAEQTLASSAQFGTFICFLDISNMQVGDNAIIRVYTKVLSTGTLWSVIYQAFSNAPTGNGDQIAITLPVTSDQQISFTLQQPVGTGRNFDWKVFML